MSIMELAGQGFSAEEIADQLCLDVGVVVKALEKQRGEMENPDLSIDEQVEMMKPAALRTLREIMMGSENDAARVKSAAIILGTKQTLSKDSIAALKDRFEAMRVIVDTRPPKVEKVDFDGELAAFAN